MQIECTTRSLLSVFFRQWRRTALVFLVILLSGIGYLLFAKPTYEVSGSLLVKFDGNMPQKIMRSENGVTVISQDDRRETMKSNMDILESHNLQLALVREIGAENIYPGITERVAGTDIPEEAAVTRILKTDLTVKSSEFSNVIEVKFQNHDPRIAVRYVKRLMDMFIVRQSDIYNKPQTDLLAEQVKDAQAKLEASQKKLEEFKSRYNISSLDDELNELLRQKSDTGTASLESSDSAWDKLSDLQSEEQKLLQTYRPDSPQVVRAHQNVVLARNQLEQRKADLRQRTGTETTRISRRIALLESQRKEYDDLARQVQIDEANYKNYQLSGEEQRVNAMLNKRNVTPVVVVDEPLVPLRPAYPRKLLTLLLSVLSGLVASLGVAFMFEVYDQRFTDPVQLEYTLGVPAMASFGAAKGKNA